MRVISNANVVVSAGFWLGPPFDCLTARAQGRCEAVVRPVLLAEHHETQEELRPDSPRIKPFEWVAVLTESAELAFPGARTSAPPFPEPPVACRTGMR